MPSTKAGDRWSGLVDDVERTHEQVVITRRGKPAAVLLSPGDLDALEEIRVGLVSGPDGRR